MATTWFLFRITFSRSENRTTIQSAVIVYALQFYHCRRKQRNLKISEAYGRRILNGEKWYALTGREWERKNEEKSPQQLTLIHKNTLNLLHLNASNAPIPSENSIELKKSSSTKQSRRIYGKCAKEAKLFENKKKYSSKPHTEFRSFCSERSYTLHLVIYFELLFNAISFSLLEIHSVLIAVFFILAPVHSYSTFV